MITACKKDKKAFITVNVQSAQHEAMAGIGITLLSDEHRIYSSDITTVKSNNSGKITFAVVPGKTYYLFHDTGDGNILVNDENASYIITGKFTSEEQLRVSPQTTPPEKVGDNIYQDINQDGGINKYDRVVTVKAPAEKTLNVNFTVMPQ